MSATNHSGEPTFVVGDDLSRYVTARAGEQRIGQQLPCFDGQLPLSTQLQQWQQAGIRYVLLGIPEDLGPRANLGRGGADGGWLALLTRLANLQWHAELPTAQLALLGHIEVADLLAQAEGLSADEPAQLSSLRALVAELDDRAAPALSAIFAAGLVPIVIGGGHNNALPIIRGYQQGNGRPAKAINLDPHADSRPCEGRHSGNPFRYALQEGTLSRYAVVGLNPYKNSADTLAALAQFGCIAKPRLVASEAELTADISSALAELAQPGETIGVELDLDAIAMMPSSAQTLWGVSLAQSQGYLQQVIKRQPLAWLHLAEGAPCHHGAGLSAGQAYIGDSLAALLLAALAADQRD